MNADTVRQAFNDAIQRQAGDPEKVARLELAREFFTRPVFAKMLAAEIERRSERSPR